MSPVITRAYAATCLVALCAASGWAMQSGTPRAAPPPSNAAVVTARDAGAPIEIVVGSSTLVNLPGRVQAVVLAHPTVADAQPVSPREVVLVGREMGTTDVIFRLESGESVVRSCASAWMTWNSSPGSVASSGWNLMRKMLAARSPCVAPCPTCRPARC